MARYGSWRGENGLIVLAKCDLCSCQVGELIAGVERRSGEAEGQAFGLCVRVSATETWMWPVEADRRAGSTAAVEIWQREDGVECPLHATPNLSRHRNNVG